MQEYDTTYFEKEAFEILTKAGGLSSRNASKRIAKYLKENDPNCWTFSHIDTLEHCATMLVPMHWRFSDQIHWLCYERAMEAALAGGCTDNLQNPNSDWTDAQSRVADVLNQFDPLNTREHDNCLFPDEPSASGK